MEAGAASRCACLAARSRSDSNGEPRMDTNAHELTGRTPGTKPTDRGPVTRSAPPARWFEAGLWRKNCPVLRLTDPRSGKDSCTISPAFNRKHSAATDGTPTGHGRRRSFCWAGGGVILSPSSEDPSSRDSFPSCPPSVFTPCFIRGSTASFRFNHTHLSSLVLVRVHSWFKEMVAV